MMRSTTLLIPIFLVALTGCGASEVAETGGPADSDTGIQADDIGQEHTDPPETIPDASGQRDASAVHDTATSDATATEDVAIEDVSTDTPAQQDVPANEDAPEPEESPLGDLDVSLYINVGDSVAAGYNSHGRNGEGGRGYARLMHDNHPDYPAYASQHIRALFPNAQFADLGDSGATSSDARENVEDALRGGLPNNTSGDVVVTLFVGGNDINDDVYNLVLEPQMRVVAELYKANVRAIVDMLRQRYEPGGSQVVFLIANVHEPTDGMGSIPGQFDDGFCGVLQHPALALVRDVALANFSLFNDEVANVVAELDATLVDTHSVFLGHGMNAAGTDRWIDDDCVHFTNDGHHQLRREMWRELSGFSD